MTRHRKPQYALNALKETSKLRPRFFAKLPGDETLHRQVEAVRGISFDVREDEIFGFLGPNGGQRALGRAGGVGAVATEALTVRCETEAQGRRGTRGLTRSPQALHGRALLPSAGRSGCGAATVPPPGHS